jgi:hypothetical protein
MLAKGVQVTAIITCSSVWFAGSKFGLTWRAKQIAIHKLPEKIGDFAFKGLETAPSVAAGAASAATEDEEEMEDDAAFRPAAASSSSSVVASMMPSVQDDDGDDVEPIPAPKRTVIKKIVTRK